MFQMLIKIIKSIFGIFNAGKNKEEKTMTRIKHEDWKRKWIGKIIDFDNAYGGQCVDVARQHMFEVDGMQVESVRGAADFFTQHNSRPIQRANYDAIAYREGLIPPVGAKIVWAATDSNGFYGHIAIVDSGNRSSFVALEQDGFANPEKDVNKGTVTGLVEKTKNYNNVLGWLVLKGNKQKQDANLNMPVPANGKYPPAGAVFAPSDTNGRVNEYWFNPRTQSYMILATNGWKNI